MLKNYFNTVDEIKAAGSISVNTNGFYFRRDIFDTLGIETVPTTLEGVMEMLAKVKELTGGDSLDSNIQLVFNNARLAAQTAAELCRLG